jgi:hypothetical protein
MNGIYFWGGLNYEGTFTERGGVLNWRIDTLIIQQLKEQWEGGLTIHLIVECFSDSDCCVFFFLPLKLLVDENLVLPRLPVDIINKRAYPMSDILWGRGLMCWNGRRRTGGWHRKPWLLHIIFYSPLKNMSGRKFSHAAPPRWYHKQTSIPDVGLTVGKGYIALEWAPDDRGRRWKPIWLSSFISDSPLKNVMDGNLVFQRPPDEFINKRAYPTLDLLWGRGLSRQNGRWRMGDGLKANLIVEFIFGFSP